MHSKSNLDVHVPPCFMPPLDMQSRAYPRVATYTPLRGFQRVRWAPLRCTLLVHQHVSKCPTTPWTDHGCGCMLTTPWTLRVLQAFTRLANWLRRTGCRRSTVVHGRFDPCFREDSGQEDVT